MLTRTNLQSSDYEHPMDKVALQALKKIPLLSKVTAAFIELSMKLNVKIEHDGNCIIVSDRTVPRIQRLKEIALVRLNMPKDYPVYIRQEWVYNAYTTGVNNPFIVLHSSLVEDLTDEELLFIIGHEMGHIKSDHLLYYQMSTQVMSLVSGLGVVGTTIAQGLILALMEWHRKSELTADRAGLLVCRDSEVACMSLAKLMGMPENKEQFNFTTDTILQQAEEFRDVDDTVFKKLVYAYLTATLSHPWGASRIKEIDGWGKTEQYRRLV